MAQIHILLATDRLAVYALFSHVQEIDQRHFVVMHVPMAREILSECPTYVPIASLFIVDVAPDPLVAIKLCQVAHAQRPDLPIVGLICCWHAVTSWQLRELVSAGVRHVLDFHSAAEEIARLLHRIVDGDAVIHLQLSAVQRSLLEEIVGDQLPHNPSSVHHFTDTDIRILELLAHGMSDREIGRAVHLSEHTVKHCLERLRLEVGARNRIELAAWAGQQGLFRRSAGAH